MKSIVFMISVMALACFSMEAGASDSTSSELYLQAQRNGWQAQKAFRDCLDFVNGWLAHRDPATGLIPRNLTQSNFWNAKDSAADNYPFMVLTTSMLDEPRFETTMKQMLETEQRLTNRLDNLPDDYDFAKQGFRTDEYNLHDLIFGGSEYVKDGLIPLTEWLGPSDWSQRMMGIEESIWKYAPVETPFGKLPSDDFEINGEQLQVLCRLYWTTRDERYREWAFRIADYYLLGHSPISGEKLSLDDHGCEIISGLAAGYYLASHTDQQRREDYRKPVYAMLDRLLEIATNEDGLFHMFVNPQTGEVLRDELTDNWGYDYNAYLNVGMLDHREDYIDAVKHVLANIHKYVHYPWEGNGADGYADAIEGGINLLNRLPDDSGFGWVDDSMDILLAKQRDDGVIEGWHGDGNFARTALMYALMKTQGVRMQPWRADLAFGGVVENGALYLALRGDWNWRGKILFDRPRHRDYMHLPSDYPRINQFPEWFTIDENIVYEVTINHENTVKIRGADLLDGLKFTMDANSTNYIRVNPVQK